MKHLILLASVILCISINAQSLLKSGPMLGYSDMKEAAIWVQTTEAVNVKIAYWVRENPDSVLFTQTTNTKAEDAFTTVLTANKVEPGSTYQYKLYINDEEMELPYPTQFQTQANWRWRNNPPNFSFATGSCAYINDEKYDRPGTPYGSHYQIFESIYQSKPDFMLWLGDNTYLREPDWNTWTGITDRWTHTRSLNELQPMLASIHNYAIWDDHDYGPNNSDRGWWNKNQTFEAFKLFWANPSYGVGDMKGVITQFQWYDVDFILLDNRFYRSPNETKSNNKTILGTKQKQWLKDVLSSSVSTFKIVALGGQFLNDAGTFELYSREGFANERQEIIDFIYENNIKNIVFVTGDRHHTELSVLKKEGEPTILDITVSPLTSGPSSRKDEENTLRLPDTYTNMHNYGLLSFSGTEKERKLTIEIINADGVEIWERTFLME